jgi:cell division protein FtsQ
MSTIPLRRVVLVVGAVAAAIFLWIGYLALRDLSLFKVRHVTVKGLTSRDSPAIGRALRQTAVRMTTLHVREDQLRKSVDSFPIVHSVSASADFPSGLVIHVEERIPVALAEGAGRQVPVAGDATLLPVAEKGVTLPVIAATEVPPSGELRDRAALGLVRLLAGAPRELRPLLARAKRTKRGFEADVRNGPALVFGDLSRLPAKWAAAARVLADPSARGARSLDLRLPERPSASGFTPSPEAPPATTSAVPQP